MSDSVRPHRRQPSRLPCPWDSPGKNTGVGCHFLLQCMKVENESEVTQSCPTLSDPIERSLPGSSDHGIFQARVLEWVAIAFSDILSYLPSKRMGCLSGFLVSSDSIQKLFCGSWSAFKWSFDEFAREKVVSHLIPPPSWNCPSTCGFLYICPILDFACFFSFFVF